MFDQLFANLQLGFGVAFSLENVLFCLLGALIGTVIGVLPGLGPTATLAMLLPITFHMPAAGALIMLAGIYYGAQYGGSTTAILVNLPGEASSVVTCLDGHAMARAGRAGAALALAAIASFFAGTIATIVIAIGAPWLSTAALEFQSPEYFSLMVFGLIGVVVLAHGSVPKAIAMILLGLLLGTVRLDVNSGEQRFTFGIPELTEGIDFVPVAMGLFGIADVILNLERRGKRSIGAIVGSLLPTRKELRTSIGAMLRGTTVGSILGILPGGGAVLSSFASYALEKKLARDPSRFGAGAPEGVAGPEAANNAGSQTSFIPMLTLGIPMNPVMALMIGVLILKGVSPGPRVMTQQPELFWGVIASMWLGNLILVVINLPLIGIWVRLLRVPYRLLFPAILLICAIGAYSSNNSTFDIWLLAIFSVVGYILLKLGCEPAPLLLGFILGPMMEENLRRSLLLSRGDPVIFVDRPISLGLLLAAAALIVVVLLPSLRRVRLTAFRDD